MAPHLLTGFICLFTVLSLTRAKAQQDVITFDVGSFTVTLLSEGQRQGNADMLIGATEEMLKQAVPNGTYPNAVNAFLVKTESKTILFDAGYGRKLFDNLKACGTAVEDIDAIVLTHMHGDHIGGMFIDGQRSFPKAELYIPKLEHDYWMSDEAMQQTPENRRNRFMGARNVIRAYKDRLHIFTPGELGAAQELLAGIGSVAIYGHTPGHTGYLLESDGSKLFIWGDLTHAMAIQMPYPEVAVTADVAPVKATESRRRLFQYLADNGIRAAGMHIPFPAIGDIEKSITGGYIFKPVCECEGR